ATICDLAGIEIPTTNEGISFKPVLKGKKDRIRDVLYGCYCGGTKPGMRSIRKGDWKLIRYETLDGKIKETQLFNLRENPNELLIEHHAIELVRLIGNQPTAMQRNLADDQTFAEKRKEMEALLRTEMEILDDPYRFDEGYINRPLKQKRKNRPRNKSAKSDSK
ncbi:sulfatase, partial [Pirellulaceae bacterium]|nr:sulfatase [Pirellulaceae bacterium]